ncbi:MAG: cupin domain-containing protein [Chloroflexota bacterium]
MMTDTPKVLAQQNFMPIEPRSKAIPHLWEWRDTRAEALHMGATVHNTERRVVRLANPALEPRVATTNTLFAGVQIVMPGEIARAHRHTQSALRFVIESTGGYTNVNGDCIPMLPGDLVLTPNWNWHDHANTTDLPMIWLDGLDTPLVGMLEAEFYEEYPENAQPVGEARDTGLTKFGGRGLVPRWEEHRTSHSPLLHYPWDDARATLQRLASTAQASATDGVILEYVNPVTGGPVMPTIACHVQMLRPGEHTAAHRHVSSTIYHVVEGSGTSVVNGKRLEWGEKDVFCVPMWASHEHLNTTKQPSLLFSFTDTPLFQRLDLYREEARPNEG